MDNSASFRYSTGKPKYILNYSTEYECYYNLLHYELDKKMYYYGDNFKSHSEIIPRSFSKKVHLSIRLLLDFLIWLKILVSYKQKPTWKIWSSAYFNVDKFFNDSKFICGRPPWAPSIKSKLLFNYKLYKLTSSLKTKIELNDANSILTEEFFEEIEVYKIVLRKFVVDNKISAAFLPHNFGFFEKIIVEILHDLGRPTFLFNHGLPYYWKSCDNISDYFVVWGNAIKNNYIKAGYLESRILVSGHPLYKFREIEDLSFCFTDILVITKSVNGVPSCDEYTLRDRGNCIVYLNMIQTVLETFGVRSVRFRPHPSENPNWYLKFIDRDFYTLDSDQLSVSLKRSTLLIGPTSTLFLESLISGVNYVVFEPILSNGNTFDNFKPIAPFDSTDDRVPCANNVEGLLDILRTRRKVNPAIISDYFSDGFNTEIILNLIECSI